jgi:hypothetical protein
MRFLSFRILAACILLPPVLYLALAYGIDRGLQGRFEREVEEAYLGDPSALLDGSIRIRDAIKANIDRCLSADPLIRYGFSVHVTVLTKAGKILYPALFDASGAPPLAADPMTVAEGNFELLNEGLIVQVAAEFQNNRLLSNMLLALLILAAMLVLFTYYRRAARKAVAEDEERHREIDRLRGLEQENTAVLNRLSDEREALERELDGLKAVRESERSRAERDEEDLIEEITALEKKLGENIGFQDSQQEQIRLLNERIELLEKDQRKEERYKLKSEAEVCKRFATLYKTLQVNSRAVEGFLALNEELKLKAEEVIHQLNENPEMVAVKRKVFGKKNRETVLEVVFAYKGRLYFKRGADRRVEVLAIGTKNTQSRELEFLSSL